MNLSQVRTILGLFVVFFALGLAVQHAGLHAPMYYDSAGNIAEKQNIFAWEGLSGVMNLFPQRPLPTITFYLNYLVSGTNPVLYRVFNIGLLAATAVLVALLVRVILDLSSTGLHQTTGVKTFASVFAAVLFLLHPLQTYLTLYIWQRMALLACFFSYACLLVFLAVRSGRWQKQRAGYAVCVLLFIAAMLSKENSVTLPVILVLADIAFFTDSWVAVAKRVGVYAVLTLVVLASVSVLQHPHGNPQLGTGILSTIREYYAESGLTVWQVVYTQSRVVFSYLFLLLFPMPSLAQLINPQVLSLSLTNPPGTAAAVAGIVGLVSAGLYLLKKVPLWGFGIMFFLVNLLPEGFLVPQYAFFGYRPVLPMLGVLLIIGDCMARFLTAVGDSARWRLVRACGVALLGGVLIFLGTSTALRADLWSDPIRFWKETVAAFPQDQRHMERKVAAHALGNAGAALYAAERYEEAADYYEQAIALSPQDPRKIISLAAVYAESGRLDEAEKLLRGMIADSPAFVPAYKNLSIVLMKSGKMDQAIETLRECIARSPHDASLYETMGQVLLSKKGVSAAVVAFQKAVSLDPQSAALHFQLAQALFAAGNAGAAKDALHRAVALKPDYWEAYNSLGIVYAREGKKAQALEQFRKALSIDPGNPQLRYNVETASKQLGQH